jgi:hypothetical protein
VQRGQQHQQQSREGEGCEFVHGVILYCRVHSWGQPTFTRFASCHLSHVLGT